MPKKVTINGVDLIVKHWDKMRVLTLSDISSVFQYCYDGSHCFANYNRMYPRDLKRNIDFYWIDGGDMTRICHAKHTKSGGPVITETGYRKLRRIIRQSRRCNVQAVHLEVLERYYRGDMRDALDCTANPENFVAPLVPDGIWIQFPDEEEYFPELPSETEEDLEFQMKELEFKQSKESHQQRMDRFNALTDLAEKQKNPEMKEKLLMMAASILTES